MPGLDGENLEMILRHDGEHSLNALEDEVKARRNFRRLLQTHGRDRRANG